VQKVCSAVQEVVCNNTNYKTTKSYSYPNPNGNPILNPKPISAHNVNYK